MSSTSKKRDGYIEWEEYFMATALLAEQRSKDPHTQVGACLINEDKRIVGVGYNGFPLRCSDDDFPWSKGESPNELDSKHMYVVHAEVNAIIGKPTSETRGCTIYVTEFPCNNCAKVIIQSHIKNVIYLRNKKDGTKEDFASKKMLDTAGIEYTKFNTKREKIEINFQQANKN